MKRELKDGMLLVTLWECPDCGEREGYKITRMECLCKLGEGDGYQ
jgi:hypothetical protein